jgi:hypothetical protein
LTSGDIDFKLEEYSSAAATVVIGGCKLG